VQWAGAALALALRLALLALLAPLLALLLALLLCCCCWRCCWRAAAARTARTGCSRRGAHQLVSHYSPTFPFLASSALQQQRLA
jgi:hypothetical protein